MSIATHPRSPLRARTRPAAALLLIVVAGALMSACSTFSTYRTAQPMTRGRTQALLAPQVNAAGPRETGKAPFPELALSVRHGVTDELELGGTVVALPLGQVMGALGAEATGKLHLHRTSGGRLDIAVGAGMGYRVFRTSGAIFEMVHASLPLIAGINVGDDELVLSPMASWQRWYSAGAHPVDIPALGMSVGYRWQITPGFAVLPELSWATSSTTVTGFDQTALFHAGVAFIVGRR